MSSELYFKITNRKECHFGFQYKDGLNILKEEFNDNPDENCVPGRLYFCKPQDIHHYLDYGIYLREIFLPTNNPDFKMVKNPSGDKYGANMIILGKRYFLSDPDTWKYLYSIGAKIDNIAIDYIIRKNYLNCLKFLIEEMRVNFIDYNCLSTASRCGNLRIVKYLINFKHENESIINAMESATNNGYLEVIKYLLSHFYDNNKAFKYLCEDLFLTSCTKYNLEIVKYFVSLGVNIKIDDYGLILASKNGNLEIVKYLISLGANIHVFQNKPIRVASKHGHKVLWNI
ncbi:ankyrin repeat protein [Acanthamoeba polyphaga moumouvirus]|uniref:Ankyrin repeat protein n=1 Tax=Acanthamoeba polyphaga moumouvirus TaxID=1269028 RepID=L7RBP7_9VIRU|nr:ankyrin repeat protein [Acanthamoeba polyphaga moumouvirus]AGC01597.1 ankyrin repeat protein [Acanthamoeba polyphaga moumouvirus]AQN67922.1 ankyrin repeat protein [Saudi moumouvirus]